MYRNSTNPCRGGCRSMFLAANARLRSGQRYTAIPVACAGQRGWLPGKQIQHKENTMPAIGWIFILLAFGLVIGSLLLLRDSSNMKIPEHKLEKIRKRKAELDEKEKQEKDDW